MKHIRKVLCLSTVGVLFAVAVPVQAEQSTNRISSNRISSNRISSNRIAFNRIAFNRISSNRIAANHLSANQVAGEGAFTDVMVIQLPNGAQLSR